MIFETHAHYDLPQYDNDREALFERLNNANIGRIVCPAIGFESNRQMLKVLKPYQKVSFAVGIHPSRTPLEGFQDDEMEMELRKLTTAPRVVAIGELGLDYHGGLMEHTDFIERQRVWFRRQLGIARESGLPLVLHLRSENEQSEQALWDGLAILQEQSHRYKGVVHCFHDSYDVAKRYLDAGEYYFGIGGVLLFAGQEIFRDAVKKLPLDCLVLETDSPFLSPKGKRERNTSLILPDVIRLIAELKHCDAETVEAVTTENAERLFGC